VLAASWLLLTAATSTELNNQGVTAAKAGRREEGVELLRQALAADPNDATAKRNLSGVLTDRARELDAAGRVDEAVAALREASVQDPSNSASWLLLGDVLHTRKGDAAGALDAWRRALRQASAGLKPAIDNRIATAQRDQLIERGFADRTTPHFTIRFQASRPVDPAALERLLEARYAALAAELGRGPSTLMVIVYSEEDLRRVHGQRDWAIGLYDGRIRLRVDDLVQAALPDVVGHELAHAFLFNLYGSRVPVWVHEGYAQLQEQPLPPAPEVERLRQGMRDKTMWIPLKWLDRHFQQPTGAADIRRAYLQARLVVEALIRRHGMLRFKQFLEALAGGRPVEVAYEAAFAPSRWAQADQGAVIE